MKTQKDLEIFYDDAEEVKVEEQRKPEIQNTISDLSTVRMISEESPINFGAFEKDKKKKLMYNLFLGFKE